MRNPAETVTSEHGKEGGWQRDLETERKSAHTFGTWKFEEIEDFKLTVNCSACWVKGLLNTIT